MNEMSNDVDGMVVKIHLHCLTMLWIVYES
jgi:hypothetical protein